MIKSLAVGIVAFGLAPVIAAAQAKYAGEFLSSGAGARSAGVGGAGTAMTDDVTAGYFNPAALSLIDYPQMAIFHESRFLGQINYDYVGAALPLGADQTVALSAIRLGLDGIKDSRNALVDNNGNGVLDEDDRIDESKITLGGASDWAFFASYAKTIDEKLAVGGSVKILYRSVLDHSAWGLGIDAGALYRPTEELALGAALTDATTSLLSWDTGKQEFILPTLKLGAAYRLQVLEDHSVTPTVDGLFRFEGRSKTAQVDLGVASMDVQGGLEYSFRDRVFIRAGYSEVGQLTVGAGIKLPKLNIDYAFIQRSADQEGLGQTHRVSLMLTLEEPKFMRGEGATE